MLFSEPVQVLPADREAIHRIVAGPTAKFTPDFLDIAESLCALMQFFSNAAVQAAIERGLSEAACEPVQRKIMHKGAPRALPHGARCRIGRVRNRLPDGL